MSVTAKTLIESKYAANSATTEYTCPADTHTIIDKFTACNDDSGAVTLTVYLVPSGGTAGASNQMVKAYSLAAGANKDFTELQNQILNAGDFISIVASAASKVAVRGSGREVT